MNQISDDYISYDESFTVKQEKLSDSEESLAPPLLVTLESATLCTSVPPVLQSLSNLNNFLETESSSQKTHCTTQKRKPFIIIKTKNEDFSEVPNLKFEDDEKLLSRSKRIAKRVKAKQRSMLKQEYSCSLSSNSSKPALDGCDDLESDGKTKKKIIQMIRNRVSAQTSREKKKAYVQNLEQAKDGLSEAYSKLFSENAKLLLEIKKLKETQAKILQENEQLKRGNPPTYDSCNYGSVVQAEEKSSIDMLAPLHKDIKELSEVISSQIPNCDKSEFQNIFECATLASINLLKVNSKTDNLNMKDNLKEVNELVSKVMAKMGSIGKENFSLPTLLKQLRPCKDQPLAVKNSEFLLDLQDDFDLDPCSGVSSMIKIEQPEIDHTNEPHLLLFNQMFGFRNSEKLIPGYASEEPTLTSASPKTLRYCNDDDEEEHEKGSLFQSCFEKAEYFKEHERAENAKFNFFDPKQSFLPNFSEDCDEKF